MKKKFSMDINPEIVNDMMVTQRLSQKEVGNQLAKMAAREVRDLVSNINISELRRKMKGKKKVKPPKVKSSKIITDHSKSPYDLSNIVKIRRQHGENI